MFGDIMAGTLTICWMYKLEPPKTCCLLWGALVVLQACAKQNVGHLAGHQVPQHCSPYFSVCTVIMALWSSMKVTLYSACPSTPSSLILTSTHLHGYRKMVPQLLKSHVAGHHTFSLVLLSCPGQTRHTHVSSAQRRLTA